MSVQHDASAHRVDRRRSPKDESISREEHRFVIEKKIGIERRRTGGRQPPQTARAFTGALVDSHRPASEKRLRRLRKQAHVDARTPGRQQRARRGDRRSARRIIASETLEVDGDTGPRDRFLNFVAMDLDSSHASTLASRQDFDVLSIAQHAGGESPGDDRAESLEDEGSIDRKSGDAGGRTRRNHAAERSQLLAKRLDPLPRPGRHRNDRCFFEGVALHEVRDLLRDGAPRRVPRQIAFADDDDPACDVEHRDDREMFPGLRLHAVIRGDEEKHGIEAGRSRHHMTHESLVSRDVNDRNDAVGSEV
jgi:hypothetical protein